ncbi:hypothetical protein [Opitutus sp. GAS368]|uniref:hypothetical protein n=1 Tax=Opitutus sp. GAS368 TaxID=1882749 RepID=UPI00087B5045|nr:hypothetical protein [Opitutus sp. GAS368]SDS02856.1 hypothetical protein SAMN05444173_1671 [Opitutus sp. GAS368]
MGICDVCNAGSDGVTVPVRTFQRAVVDGKFNPFQLRLAVGRAGWSHDQNLAYWSKVVRENETDWFLCHACHRAFHAQTQSEAEAAATPRAPVQEIGLPNSLEPLRRLHPLPPPPGVPADWKPGLKAGLFGRGKPWGDAGQATALIRHGRISEARELLQRLVLHGTDNPTRLLFCFEGRRPPHDETFKIGKVVAELPPADKTLIDTLVAFGGRDYNWLGESFLAAAATRPSCEFAAFLLLADFVTMSDQWLQTQLLHPRKRVLESMIVCRPLRAVALLLERRHDEAWESFHHCITEPESIVTAYEKALQLPATPAERAKLTDAGRIYGEVGLGLVLFDLGYTSERRTHFARLAPRLGGGLAEASRMLA